MKEQAFTTPQLANDHFDIVIQETRALGCKNSRAKASEQWFADSKNTQICSTVTTQNGYSLSEFEISQESIMQDKVEEDMGTTQDFCEEEFKVAVELQRKKLVEDFQIEMNKKMDEVEQKICKRWEDAIVKMHVDYEQKVEKHNEMLKEIKEKKQEEMENQRVQLEKEINEKYQKDYMEKLDALTENLQKVEQDRYIEIINEVKAELETEFGQRNEIKLAALQAEIQEEIANEKEKDEESMIKAELIENLEKDMKEAYDLELTDLVVRQQRDIVVLKDCVRDLEEGVNYEDMKTEVKERMAQEYHIKEDMMNRDWKEKMELFKKETEEGIAQQRTKRLSQEFLEIAIEKKGLAANDSGLKLKKVEEANKELEKRLAEQEEMYAQTVEDLRKELEVLKPVSTRNNFGERLSVRNTSAEREARKTAGGQRNSVGSTDKLRRSCGEAGLAELLMINMKTSEDSVKKTGDTWRPRRSLCSTESRKNSMEPQKGKEKSPEVRKNLSKTLMKVTLPPKQNAFPSKPFNFERATKAILQMLSPSSPSELRNGQLDMRQDTRVDTVGSKEDNECEVKEVKKTVNVPKLALHTTRNSGVSGERSERGRGAGSVERETKQSEEALRKKDVNIGARRGSVTDRKMDNKEVDKVMRSSDKAFTAKYEELLKRQGGLARRREGSVTQRKENVLVSQMKENMSKGGSIMEWRNGGKKCEYAKLFEIKNDDEQEVKNMKRLKKTVEENMKENEVLASKCNAKEVDLCVSFPLKISIQSCEQSRTLQNKLQTLFKLWKTAEVSYIARIAFIEGLEKLLRYDEIIAKIDLEINEMTKLVSQTEEIIKLLQWRTQLKDQINTDDFSYNQFEKVYLALADNNRDLKRSLEGYQNKHGKRIQYRGVDLGEIVELDAWECEFLQKINCQRNSVQRLK